MHFVLEQRQTVAPQYVVVNRLGKGAGALDVPEAGPAAGGDPIFTRLCKLHQDYP